MLVTYRSRLHERLEAGSFVLFVRNCGFRGTNSSNQIMCTTSQSTLARLCCSHELTFIRSTDLCLPPLAHFSYKVAPVTFKT
jgi:hypothetical protein